MRPAPENLADPSLDPLADDRFPDLATNGHAKTGFRLSVGMNMECRQASVPLATPSVATQEVLPTPKPVATSQPFVRKSGTPVHR